jgi:hypothetical protein
LTLGTGSDISNVGGNDKKFVAGFHDLTGCGLGSWVNSGFKHGFPTDVPPFVTPVLDVTDPEGLYYITVQYLVHPQKPACVWANYYSFDGATNNNFLTGTCTKSAKTRGAGKKSSAPRAAK